MGVMPEHFRHVPKVMAGQRTQLHGRGYLSYSLKLPWEGPVGHTILWEFHLKYIVNIQYFLKNSGYLNHKLIPVLIYLLQQPILPNRTKEENKIKKN